MALFKELCFVLFLLQLVVCQSLPSSNRSPKSCPDTYCMDVPGYPERDIISAVRRNPYYKKVLGPGGISPPSLSQKSKSGNSLKMGRETPIILSGDYQQACDVYPVATDYPKAARNVQNVTRYIVNAGNYKQPVTTEKCRNENQSCDNLDKYLLPGVSTSCRSSYVTLTLVVYDEETKQLGNDLFSFPTACVCYYKTDH